MTSPTSWFVGVCLLPLQPYHVNGWRLALTAGSLAYVATHRIFMMLIDVRSNGLLYKLFLTGLCLHIFLILICCKHIV